MSLGAMSGIQFEKLVEMEKTLIIAEAGVNHNGSIDIAKEMVDAAVHAGVDIIKFQTFKADLLVARDTAAANYQQRHLKNQTTTQHQMLKRLELSYSDHRSLQEYCKSQGILFWSTAFDFESIDLLRSLGMNMWKIPSGEVTNYPYLRRLASFHEPIIMSTGLCTEKDINDALKVLKDGGMTDDLITLLHCNTQYPTPFSDVNLLAMVSMRDRFGLKVGYSDHTLGIEVPIAAVALGAKVIEKHFTLDRKMLGPDHQASLEPNELEDMVRSIRRIEVALGDGVKNVTNSEYENIAIARKSIVASCPIRKGDVFSEENLTVRRPGTGLSPMEWPNIIGRKSEHNFCVGEQIKY